MSLGETVKKFFTETKKSDKKEEEEIIKTLSLSACEDKHKILIECYKTSMFGSCQREMESFWKCVNENKAILKEKVKSYKEDKFINDGK